MIKLSETVKKLEFLFDEINSYLFDNVLIKPVIAINPDRRGSKGGYTLGWFTLYKAWKVNSTDDENNGGYYEINVTCDYLNRPFAETVATLIHEMVHLYNLQMGIKDCSRWGNAYHNKRFAQAAQKYGLTVKYNKSRGFNETKLNEDTAHWINTRFPNESFNLYRGGGKKRGAGPEDDIQDLKQQSSRKYICPDCQTIVRATKCVNIICGDCNVSFVSER
jgi:hypothetical protein